MNQFCRDEINGPHGFGQPFDQIINVDLIIFNLKAHGKSSKLAVRGVISIEIIAKILACLLMRIVTN